MYTSFFSEIEGLFLLFNLISLSLKNRSVLRCRAKATFKKSETTTNPSRITFYIKYFWAYTTSTESWDGIQNCVMVNYDHNNIITMKQVSRLDLLQKIRSIRNFFVRRFTYSILFTCGFFSRIPLSQSPLLDTQIC